MSGGFFDPLAAAVVEHKPLSRWRGATVEVLPLTFPEYAAAHSVEPKASSAGTVSALFERYPETGDPQEHQRRREIPGGLLGKRRT